MGDQLYKTMRTCVNKGHSAIAADDAYNDMPNPPFPDEEGNNKSKVGQWFAIDHNSKYSYLRDLNYKECTGGITDWYFEYLNGESDFGDSGAPKFGRSNWEFNNMDNTNPKDKNWISSNNCNNLFINKADSPAKIYGRTDTNVSAAWYMAVTDHINWGKSCTYSKTDGKAHYAPAKGITFRYYERADDRYKVGEYSRMWMRPFNFGAMLYSNGEEGSPVYLAELIAFSSKEAKADGCLSHSHNSVSSNSSRRRPAGNLHYKTDWYYIKENSQGEPYPTMAGPSWNGMGQGRHVDDDSVTNDYDPRHYGTITATISEKSVKRIQDMGLMCVGIIIGAQTYNECGYTNPATMTYEIFDVKLLVPEFYGDNKIEIVNYDKIENGEPLMTMILDEPSTCYDAHKNYMAKRDANTMTRLFVKQ